MPGLFGLSVDPSAFKGPFYFQDTLFLGTFYHQHLCEARCGFAALNGEELRVETASGLIRPNFEKRMESFSGSEGIGYCGGSGEPFKGLGMSGRFAACFSGNVINKPELLRNMLGQSKIFDKGDDIEVIANLVAGDGSWTNGIRMAAQDIKGSFALLILTKEGIYATVSTDSHWPLVVASQPGAVAVGCESCGFSNLGFSDLRNLQPGEIVLLKNGLLEVKGTLNNLSVQICKFLWVYTNNPASMTFGISTSLVRKKLGASLACYDIETGFVPDIVTYVPDSGRGHAIGYHNEFCRAVNEGRIKRIPLFDEVVFKYPYAGRSYTPSSQKDRDREAYIKILPSAERFDGLTVAVLDDSVVRGTQLKNNLVPKLRSLGFREIHVRSSNPELLSHCPWGKTTQPGEVLADKIKDWDDRARFLGVDSLRYNSIADLQEAIGMFSGHLCIDCAVKN